MKKFLTIGFVLIAALLTAADAGAAQGRGFLGIRGRINDRQELRQERRADRGETGGGFHPFRWLGGMVRGGC